MRDGRVLTSKRSAGNAHLGFQAVLLQKHFYDVPLIFLVLVRAHYYRFNCEAFLRSIIQRDVGGDGAVGSCSEFYVFGVTRIIRLINAMSIAQRDDAVLLFFYKALVLKKWSN